ncbi:hypothetical protein PNO29_01355 [Streptococcus vestibularis]|uniref:hypothetical protein n=1 Tax=Streptococcus vestibularis TaxID=1343 RepID=UPI002330A37C|nr:hypothetical protein [Streptococcus vestibularis]HEO2476409.1 hypothetical protein [Streptococcus agalactiae]MDB6183549.1 hypothetical protein [Streptococcus vestibularis]MDB6201226.1 hypothetical protein [Streptococcus vestibularis]MDB6206979.1 hypothetical protein [Streptococcus vestibularis]MDB6210777.1 hypothetical protein [Streptococcus vestibularis]
MAREYQGPNKRVSIYFSNDRLEKLDRIIDYFKQENLLVEMKNVSQSIGYLIDTFEKLFLNADDETKGYEERLAQLMQRDQTLFDEAKKENRQLKRQLDQLLYLSLANFHVSTNPDWDVQELESVSSDYSVEQKQLLERVAQLIKEDKERGQIMKHSHKS